MLRRIVSGIMLTLLLMGMLSLAFTIQSVKAEFVYIYIRADGSVEPSTAPISSVDNVNYVFTDNIDAFSIEVQRSNITIDGKGYRLHGYSPWVGFYVASASNVTIKNTNIMDHYVGIQILTSFNTVCGNNISNTGSGILLDGASNNNVSGNNLASNTGVGIFIYYSSNNFLSGNNMTNNGHNFVVIGGDDLSDFIHYVDASNTVNGKPIYYWVNESNKAVPFDAGYLGLINCTNITAQNLNPTNHFDPPPDPPPYWRTQDILLVSTTNSTITNNHGRIELRWSSNNSIVENYVPYRWSIHSSSNNTISGNDMRYGVELSYSSNNRITRNNVTTAYSWFGFYIFESHNNTIAENNITDNVRGIYSSESSNNKVIGNIIKNNNWAGIWLDYSDNNIFYHNSFMNNSGHVIFRIGDVGNVWDNGYPSGGNYWSDYTGVDYYRGPYQNETGSDGVGDTPYYIPRTGGADVDCYPLMKPYGGSHDIGVIVATSKTIVGQGYKTTVTINVTIINYGEQTEIFNFAFQMPTAIHEEEGLTLASRDLLTFTFEWNTTGFVKGNYTINAHVTQVSGETDTTDNTNVKWIVITIPGDVTSANGQPDGKVDMRDIGVLCNNFMIKPSSPNWNPNYDINNDGVVNMRDIGIACNNFGKT